MAKVQMDGGLTGRKAYVITGPTSGIGRAAALEIARDVAKSDGVVVLVGRRLEALEEMKREVARVGGQAVSVVCDMGEMASVREAARQIVGLGMPVAGLVNNAGIFPHGAKKNGQGWDLAYATNHLGPLVLTEELMPHMPDGGNVVFVVSGAEDPERKPAHMAGFRGGRYVSAEASARGEWTPGGAKMPGMDAYATSKQCNLVAAMELGREVPRLHVTMVEPGFSPATGLGREAPWALRVLVVPVLSLLAPYIRYWSTPKRAGRVVARALRNEGGVNGVYFDERGVPMEASAQVRDRGFRERVMAETRALLAKG
jgi:NAD(P)-dependent dehydrogenase (short-subunit alcohol dehydrogenase family)